MLLPVERNRGTAIFTNGDFSVFLEGIITKMTAIPL